MKTKCPITRQQFRELAEPIATQIAGNAIMLNPIEFKPGSFGWRADGKIPIEVDGKPFHVHQVGA